MTETTTIHHYNKLEGVERLLTELYGAAMRDVKHDVNDPYSQKLLKAILAATEARAQLPWSPTQSDEEADGVHQR